MISKLITVFFVLNLISVCANAQVLQKDPKVIEEVIQTSIYLELGFPFNDSKRLKYNQFTYEIGQAIVELQKSGLLEQSLRKGTIRSIVHSVHDEINKRSIEGYVNYGSLKYSEKNQDIPTLFAALVVSSQTGDITDIVPYLEFSKVFFGSQSEAMDSPMDIDSLAELEVNKDLTHEQRMAFWPAANAILKHGKTTKPLLKEVLFDTKQKELNRLRAACFLIEMGEHVLANTYLENLEQNMINKINCIYKKDVKWNNVYTDVCVTSDKAREWMERLILRD